MASYFGSEFLFGGVSSVKYDIRFYEIDSSNSTTTGKGGVQGVISSDVIFRKSKTRFYTLSTNTPLEIDIQVGCGSPVNRQQESLIKSWLMGARNYKKLQPVQSDMQSYYYNCIITDCVNNYVGNVLYGFTFHAVCDAPYGWEEAKTLTKNYVAGANNDVFNFYNASADNDYLWPSFNFTLNGTGTGLTITNGSESNRQTIFTGLSYNEIITADCDNEILTSSTGLNRFPNFNFTFLRLIPGMNTLTLNGGISQFQLITQFARVIGG